MKDVVLLAGGLGTRLASVSCGLPKPLVEVAGKPFIEHVLDRVVDAGCSRVVMAVSYKWEMLRDHLGDSYRCSQLVWSVENVQAGTGGAVRLAFETCDLERAFVLNADTLFRVDLSELEKRHVDAKAQVTMALHMVDDVSRFGAVVLDTENRVVAFSEKNRQGSGLVNGGIYVIERSIFSLRSLPGVFSLESDLLLPELTSIRPLGVPSGNYFIDIGIPEDLERARHELSMN